MQSEDWCRAQVGIPLASWSMQLWGREQREEHAAQ